MTAEQVQSRLTGILRDVFDDESLVAAPDLKASDVPEWDSLSHVRLILTVERAFGVKFAAAEVTSLQNVDDLIRLIQSKAS
jgi:acyl carrier protein